MTRSSRLPVRFAPGSPDVPIAVNRELEVPVVSVIPRNTMGGGYLVVEQPDRFGRSIPTFPGGRIEPGESVRSAFRRESIEELGVVLDTPLLAPAYMVTAGLARQVRVTVFEAYCTNNSRQPAAQDADKVRVAYWLNQEQALGRFVRSTCRHISEPFLAYASGHVREVEWRYDDRSAHLPIGPQQPSPVVAGGHFVVRGRHTELLGTPAAYLRHPESLRLAALTLGQLLAPYKPTSLITPAVGGVALATQTAMIMELPLTIIDPRANGELIAMRGAPVSERPALVDSTYHSGRTAADAYELVKRAGASLVAGAVAVRSIVIGGHGRRLPQQIPVHAIHNILVHSWTADECPKCEAMEPVDAAPSRY